jgi:hypothetical protein
LVGCFGSLSLCVSKSRERERKRERKRQRGKRGLLVARVTGRANYFFYL